jgi:MFS transporter, MHS family, proline/betaine transporter
MKINKIITFSAIGNLLEIYDYTLYAVMISIIAVNFFPDLGELTIIFGFLSFAISFLFMPFGSIFWGWFSDKFGRKAMMQYTMMMMAAPSLLIAILPTYNDIGHIAWILLLLCRIVQGISASGEITGAKIFAMEHLGDENLGKVSGIMSGFAAIGVALAMLFAFFITKFPEYSNLWRIPFFFGSLLAIIGIFIRKQLTESVLFNKISNENRLIKITDLPDIIKLYKTQAINVIILGGFMASFSYTMHAFMGNYLSIIGYGKSDAIILTIIAITATILSSFITGIYSDKFCNRKLMNYNLIACIACFLLCFILMLDYNFTMTIFAQIILGILLGMNATLLSVHMYKLFPVEVRCRGIMFCYTLGVAIFGGTTPLILKIMSNVNMYFPAIILASFAYIALRIKIYSEKYLPTASRNHILTF